MPIDHSDLSPLRHTDGDRIVLERGARRIAIRLPRRGVITVLSLMALMAAWSVAAAAYVTFHDTVVAELRHGARIAAKAHAAQIADLRTELERSRTRRMVEQTGIEERFAELARRQDALERRQKVVAELADPALVAGERDGGDEGFSLTGKPTPLDPATPAFDDLDPAPMRRSAAEPADTLGAAIARLEAAQERTLDAVAARIGERRRKLESVYDAVGVAGPQTGGRGGPFEPAHDRRLSFEHRTEEIAADRMAVAALHGGLERIPLRTPAPRGTPVSSGYGTRLDPFLRRPAFHAGLDFDADAGAAVRATAAGRVVNASTSGGYGLMVEIDHGGGLSTRFGHLSSVAVTVGETIAAGSTVGRVGSTGRSTGPHLHYETRVDGDAVDPLRFLTAGRIVATLD